LASWLQFSASFLFEDICFFSARFSLDVTSVNCCACAGFLLGFHFAIDRTSLVQFLVLLYRNQGSGLSAVASWWGSIAVFSGYSFQYVIVIMLLFSSLRSALS